MESPRRFTFSLWNVLLAMVPLAVVFAVLAMLLTQIESRDDITLAVLALVICIPAVIGALLFGGRGLLGGALIGLLTLIHLSLFAVSDFLHPYSNAFIVFLIGYYVIVAAAMGIGIYGYILNPAKARSEVAHGNRMIWFIVALTFFWFIVVAVLL